MIVVPKQEAVSVDSCVMDAPAVLATPSSLNSNSHRQTPSHTKDHPSKDSSESAIFSIYSMYGDSRASTSGCHDSSLRTKPERQSLIRSDGRGDSELAYHSTVYDERPLPLISIPAQFNSKNAGSRGSVATSSSAHPTSSYATPSSLRAHSDLFEDSRPARNSDFRTSDLSASSYTPPPSHTKEFTRSGSPHSKRSSRSSPLPPTKDLPLLPPMPDLPLPPPMHATPLPTPPSQPPSPSPFSMKPHGKHIVPPISSPSSKVSLVPSEGEDIDAFHVRNTYAQLEASGVKGDGYEEGIERTRARIGSSRRSQLQADAALGDGKEKFRDLDEKEIQVLQSVDRCVLSINTPHALISKKIASVTDSFLCLLMTD